MRSLILRYTKNALQSLIFLALRSVQQCYEALRTAQIARAPLTEVQSSQHSVHACTHCHTRPPSREALHRLGHKYPLTFRVCQLCPGMTRTTGDKWALKLSCCALSEVYPVVCLKTEWIQRKDTGASTLLHKTNFRGWV